MRNNISGHGWVKELFINSSYFKPHNVLFILYIRTHPFYIEFVLWHND